MTIKELKEKTEGVILNVLITEKGSRLSAENRYLLEVAPDARKPVIAAMAEKAFGVHVLAVKTANMKGGLIIGLIAGVAIYFLIVWLLPICSANFTLVK